METPLPPLPLLLPGGAGKSRGGRNGDSRRAGGAPCSGFPSFVSKLPSTLRRRPLGDGQTDPGPPWSASMATVSDRLRTSGGLPPGQSPRKCSEPGGGCEEGVPDRDTLPPPPPTPPPPPPSLRRPPREEYVNSPAEEADAALSCLWYARKAADDEADGGGELSSLPLMLPLPRSGATAGEGGHPAAPPPPRLEGAS